MFQFCFDVTIFFSAIIQRLRRLAKPRERQWCTNGLYKAVSSQCTSNTMKLLGALLVLIVCLASLVSSTPVREKRQWGNPYYGYGPRPYYGYGPRPYYGNPWRRPVVVEKTVIYRNG